MCTHRFLTLLECKNSKVWIKYIQVISTKSLAEYLLMLKMKNWLKGKSKSIKILKTLITFIKENIVHHKKMNQKMVK
jgi:predicted acyltransferase